MLRKAHEAKTAGAASFTIWGSGTPRREFLHVDDLADACVFLLQRYSGELPINVGYGSDITIAELAEIVSRTVGFSGSIERDASKPDGTPRKLMSSARLAALGWSASIPLEHGLASTYQAFLAEQPQASEAVS